MSKFNDLTGQSFGRLSVQYRAADHVSNNGRKRVQWHCRCDCGAELNVFPENLVAGRTQSCGCLNRERAVTSHLSHGESKTHLYRIWLSMRRRCDNKNTAAYPFYGGRGIRVCDEWNSDYSHFRDWALANGYQAGRGHECTIDRIDVDGDYEPSNCRWVDSVVQANNRRSNQRYSYCGETHTLSEWASIIDITYKTLHNRIRSGWDFEKAITTPVQKH